MRMTRAGERFWRPRNSEMRPSVTETKAPCDKNEQRTGEDLILKPLDPGASCPLPLLIAL